MAKIKNNNMISDPFPAPANGAKNLAERLAKIENQLKEIEELPIINLYKEEQQQKDHEEDYEDRFINGDLHKLNRLEKRTEVLENHSVIKILKQGLNEQKEE